MRNILFGGTPWSESLMDSLSKSLPVMFMILDSDRRIAYANAFTLKAVGCENENGVNGKRPGEALGCECANISEGGCGCSPYCPRCGAFKSIVEALSGVPSTHECNFRDVGGTCADYRVWASPFIHKGRRFATISMLDIGNEKRRDALERCFFDEMLETASGLSCVVESVKPQNSYGPEGHVLQIVRNRVEHLLDEINFAKILTDAEAGLLQIAPCAFDVVPFVKHLAVRFGEDENVGKVIGTHFEGMGAQCLLQSDGGILGACLGKLLGNALEADLVDDGVYIKATRMEDGVLFEIHNDAVIPPEQHNDVFKRSFTTKGKGRGLGTYSARLLIERYLGGRIWFTSERGAGTVFSVKVPDLIL